MQLGGTQYTHPSIFFAPVARPAIESLLKRSPRMMMNIFHQKHCKYSFLGGQNASPKACEKRSFSCPDLVLKNRLKDIFPLRGATVVQDHQGIK